MLLGLRLNKIHVMTEIIQFKPRTYEDAKREQEIMAFAEIMAEKLLVLRAQLLNYQQLLIDESERTEP